jgi:chaperone modulatory protein CbpM
VQLIKDLKVDFGVNDEGIAIILHLIDQLHGLRCLLRDIQAVGPLHRAKDVD